jgi:cytochrome c553
VPAPSLPPDVELARIVRLGLNGTAMHAWDVPDDELDGLLQYIKTFSPQWQTEVPGHAVEPAPDPFGQSGAAAAVALGDRVFHEQAQCARCHEAGARELKTTDYCLAWQPGWKSLDERQCAEPVRELPPDLRCDPLRSVHAGSELVDLYRIIASGISGALMPPWQGSLSDDELWALAYYVRSLRAQTGCKLSRTGQ